MRRLPSDREVEPCGTCGEPTTMLGTKRCDLCWQVERLLGEYAKTARGRANLRRYGMEADR